MGIKDQHDPKADEATKALYKKEFHGGVLNENCGPYAGKTVREVKDTLIRDFKQDGRRRQHVRLARKSRLPLHDPMHSQGL